MISDVDEQAWWAFRLSDMATVHVPAETEAEAKRALASNTLMTGKHLEEWRQRVAGLVGRSRWTTRDALKREALRP